MIRILHVIDSLDLGGAQTALLNLIKPSDRTEFHHDVACMHGRGMFTSAFEDAGFQIFSLSEKRWPPGYLLRLPALIRKGNYDVIHCHLFGANWIAKPLAFLSGCRCLYNHDQCNDAFRYDSTLVTWIDTIMNHLSTRILTVSHSISTFLSESEGIKTEKLSYLPNSVDLEIFHPASAAERNHARDLFDLPQDTLVVGGVGRLTEQKQFEVFIAAATILHETYPDWVFVLFGSGPEELRLRSLAAPLGSTFRFAGTAINRAAIYHAIDVQVLPSKFEGMPMTMLEGMASALPVVASRVDGVLEVATDRETALLVDSGNIRELVNAIQEAASKKPAISQLCSNARSQMERHYASTTLSQKLHALYRQDLTPTSIVK